MQVSIIIPAYNCSSYITRCIESVLKQTYKDWELLIIDDGSNDDTSVLCNSYTLRDSRIKYYYQENQGQGIARNLGLKKANGEYIAFLDADDWWAPDTLSILTQYVQHYKTDLVFFDYITVKIHKNVQEAERMDKAPVCLTAVTNIEDHTELFYTLKGAIWDKFYHRELWKGITQPAHPYEDSAVLPMVLAKAKRIGQIQRPLYYYREGRVNSTVNRAETVYYMVDSMKEIKDYFMKQGIFEKYQEPLRKYNEWMYLVVKNHVQRVSRHDDKTRTYDELLSKCQCLIEETYPNHKPLFELEYVVWGSYNLRCMLNRTQRNLRIPKYHYCFSSIISLMSPKCSEWDVVNPNAYRNRMLQSESQREFCNMSKEEYCGIDYICIDFLEERYPIIKRKDSIATFSEALQETGVTGELLAEPMSGSYIEMCKEGMVLFIRFLKRHYRPEQIILVKNYLCEGYGTYGIEHVYLKVDNIRRQNILLEEYYTFFEANYNGIKVIENDRKELEFTDDQYPHGCYPWHQNEMLYYKIADEIEQYVVEGMV